MLPVSLCLIPVISPPWIKIFESGNSILQGQLFVYNQSIFEKSCYFYCDNSQLALTDINVPVNGTMYVYVANKSSENVDVWFDDLTIIHKKNTWGLQVTNSADYYPFSGQTKALSYQKPGGMSFGMYHAMSYGSYKFGGGNTEIAGRRLTYRQFNKINTAYQRSRFWRKEHGVYLNNDGSARFVPRNDRHRLHVTFDDWQQGDFGTFHSHWAKPGSEWAYIGGTVEPKRYNPYYNYPAGSYKVTAVGNSFSPDPFLRFSLFPCWFNY